MWAKDPGARILMIAPTAADVREVMIEGPSGLLQCFPPNERPVYNSSRHLVSFPSGAVGITRSADEPERLRGPQFTKFWADEICAWKYVDEAWTQLSFGFRLKTARLQGIITTTPKPLKRLKTILKDPGTVLTRGSSYENQANISEQFYTEVIAAYEGTRIGRQEINAEILEDTEGALWTRQLIEANRVPAVPHDVTLIRIVVAIDPAMSAKPGSNETGIIAAGLGTNGHVYVIEDGSLSDTPGRWALAALGMYGRLKADRVVAEVNNGGDLVEANLRAQVMARGFDGNLLPYRSVRASRGKAMRAEPVAALYERGRVHHVGAYPKLEDQMCIAEGVHVLTGRGALPIEQVMVGDSVITRRGWRKVSRAGLTGLKNTVTITTNRGEVRCTLDHPVWANGKFNVAGSVIVGDNMLACESRTLLSNSTERSFTETRAGSNDHNRCSRRGLRSRCGLSSAPNAGSPLTPKALRHVFVSSTAEAVTVNASPERVYDLTVEGQPEFFAGGLLVHNCEWVPGEGMPSPDRLDALVWALFDLVVQPHNEHVVTVQS